jgi:hypothetical protein
MLHTARTDVKIFMNKGMMLKYPTSYKQGTLLFSGFADLKYGYFFPFFLGA